MKFDVAFPYVEPGKSPASYISQEEYMVLPQNNHKFVMAHCFRASDSIKLPCWICGEPTSWLEVSFEAPICSEECDDKAWKQYSNACTESYRKYTKWYIKLIDYIMYRFRKFFDRKFFGWR